MTNDSRPNYENDCILRLIDFHLKVSQHNTTLVWMGVNRSILMFGAAIAIYTFFIRIEANPKFELLACTIIAVLSMIGNRMLIFSITRNIEHVYQYNKAIGELEKILKNNFKDSEWIRYLPVSVYETALEGTDAAKHNKQVARTFPWTFLFLSGLGVVVFVTWFFIEISNSGYKPEIIGVGIVIGIFLAVCVYWATPKLQSMVACYYKDETKKWDKKFNKVDDCKT
jgi:hypothetical protein